MSDHMHPSKKHKTIRSLENKANNGNIKALFQLAKYYEDGQYVEQNTEKSEVYFLKALDQFQAQSLQISSLKLINFRVFDEVEMDLCNNQDSKLMVLIGDNGAGKTTILESISLCLSWLIKRITTQGANGEFIGSLDIKNDSLADYASIITKFSLLDSYDVEIELSKSIEGSNSLRKNNLQDINQLADLYKFANSRDDQFNFPIMSYYSVERAIDIDKKDIDAFDEITVQKPWHKFDGYSKSLTGSADFKLFFSWFKYLEDIDNEKYSSNKSVFDPIERLKSELKKDILQSIEEQSKAGNKVTEALVDSLIERSKKMAELEIEIDENQYLQSNKYIEHVSKAIYTFMPGFTNLRVQRSPKLDMLIDKNDTTISVLQLSQGEKSLLALVADVARRLVILNPSLENPLEGSGIVLIDEIDLHLHPKWQQSVLPNLLKTYPEVQFIVTTHSSQVVTTVSDKSIRILNNGCLYNAPMGSKGAQSSRLLSRLFDVEARPPNDSNTKDLFEYRKLVHKDEWKSDRAQELRNKLNEQFGNEDPELTELDLYIENRIWELEIEKDK